MKFKSIAFVAGVAGISLGVFVNSATSASAATLYVNNTGTPPCSDSNPGTSLTAPLCSPPAAYTKSAANDTILVTPSTYNMPSTLNLAKAGQTWQRSVATGYATLNMGGTASYGINISAPGMTVDGFKIMNQKRAFDSQFTYWAIFVHPVVGVTIRNCYLDVPMGRTCTQSPAPNPITNCTQFVDGCISCMGGIGWQAGKFLIENNIIRGGWSFGMQPGNTYHLYTGKPDTYDPPDLGGTVRGNKFYFEGVDSQNESQVGILLETPGMWNKHSTWLFYNNEFYRATRSGNRAWAFYPREVAATLRVWNNYAYNLGTCFYLQEAYTTCLNQGPTNDRSCATEDAIYFNNTCDAGPTVNASASAVFWGGCIDSQFKNNLFKNQGYGFDFRGCSYNNCPTPIANGGGGIHDSPGGGAVANNLLFRTTNPNGLSGFTYYNGTYTAINTATPQCNDQGPFSGNLLAAPDPNLTLTGLLQTGSSAVNAGSNNPLGQGPNVCSVSDGTRTISCLVDAHGTPRGTGGAWDVGWHELGSTGPADPPPAAPTGFVRTDRETP